ncbi:MAG: LCP family protein [Candidatus Gottesmanbacteria bacterium]|nr:LCP family protein [Candidatus Gottesmanbacteria bacterium]
MKKIIAFAVFVLFIILAAKAVIWSVRFMELATLDSSDGRTNILILGIGGGDHEGADLTDTIMVLSLDMAKKTVALISIPRDIWSDTLKDKVNTAYHYGNEKGLPAGRQGGGLLLSKVIMEDIIGIPIHYAVVIDFSGFTKVIDAVGGIDVNVPETFTDTQYPKPGMEQSTCPGDPTNACVYETVHFDAGLQHMDGARALIYARSRHAEGYQGSDFARSRRQQIIMVTLKDRFMHPAAWITLSRLQALPKLLDDATDTDMTIAQALTVGRRFASASQDQIKKIAFDQLLDNPPVYLYNNLYVLIPKTNWDDIHAYIKQQL